MRNASRFVSEGSRAVEVSLTCRKQWLPFNVEVIPFWLKGDRLGQKREILIFDVPSFRNRKVVNGTTDVCHPEPSAYRGFHRSEASSMLANMSRCAQRERAKVVVIFFELLPKL